MIFLLINLLILKTYYIYNNLVSAPTEQTPITDGVAPVGNG